MDRQVFDLTVKSRCEFLALGKNNSALAFKAGLISGLNFGLARLKATELIPDWDLVDVLGSNSIIIDQAVEMVNKSMPVGVFCDASMFFEPERRADPQFARGFTDGFFYVYNLSDFFLSLFPRNQRDSRFNETKLIVESRKAEIMQFQL